MDAMQWQLRVCDVIGQGALFAIWLGVIGLSIVIGRLLRRLPMRVTRAAVVAVLMIGGLLGGPAQAFATIPTPEACYWMQASGMPCWMLHALWCPCGDDPPPPPPPPG
jgi:hypothetical protein